MIEERGRVVAIEGSLAWVETQRFSSCGSCRSQKGCGTTALSQWLGKSLSRVRVVNNLAAQVGDDVVLGLAETAFLRGALLLYGVPLAVFIAAAVVGELIARAGSIDGDWLAIVCGVIGLFSAFVWLRRHANRVSVDPFYQPVILRLHR